MSLSAHVDNKNKDILIVGVRPTQGIDDTTLIAKAKYHINFIQSNLKVVLEATVSYLLMLYMNSQQNIQK